MSKHRGFLNPFLSLVEETTRYPPTDGVACYESQKSTRFYFYLSDVAFFMSWKKMLFIGLIFFYY